MSRRNRHHRDTYEETYPRSPNPRHFRRSRDNSVIAGVCGGLGERFGWDPVILRFIAGMSIFFFQPIVIAYIVAWVITPRAPRGGYDRPVTGEEAAFWRGVSDRPRATFGQLKYTYMDLDERLQSLERTVTNDEWRLRKEFRDLEQR